MLNLDHKFSEMCTRADRHPGLLLQYVDEHLKMTDNYIQLFVLMRTRQKKESTNGPDWVSGALFYIMDYLFYSSLIFSLP